MKVKVTYSFHDPKEYNLIRRPGETLEVEDSIGAKIVARGLAVEIPREDVPKAEESVLATVAADVEGSAGDGAPAEVKRKPRKSKAANSELPLQ